MPRKSRAKGRACLACGQHVMPGELRNHGKHCRYCRPNVPSVLTGEAIMESEQNLAMKEDKRRWREQRDERNRIFREDKNA